MTTDLIDVWDAAFLGDLSTVPKSVRAIAGYVSGPDADHIWPVSDAAKVWNSGREFWAIDVPIQSNFSATTGHDAALRMIDALPHYNQPQHCPVFIDLEHDAYEANPKGGDAAVAMFVKMMNKAGYRRAYGYVPFSAGYGWVANYTFERPVSLSTSEVGWQYENDSRSHKGWDASVFRASLLGNIPSTEWSLNAMNYAVIIRRLDNGKIYRINLLEGTCNHLINTAAVNACKADLQAAGIPYTQDSVNDISAYVEVSN